MRDNHNPPAPRRPAPLRCAACGRAVTGFFMHDDDVWCLVCHARGAPPDWRLHLFDAPERVQ